ncbi:MAG: septal ring lytic transglycosylase RlpA family protein [Patescibacteria group bacterium]
MRKSAIVLFSFFFFAWLLDLRDSVPAYAHSCQVGYRGVCASYYDGNFIGRTMANGERYHTDTYAVAHRCRPFGQMVQITNLRNGKSVVVEVKDRGPYPEMLGNKKPIAYDLTLQPAKDLGMTKDGVVPIDVVTLYTPRNAKYPCGKKNKT